MGFTRISWFPKIGAANLRTLAVGARFIAKVRCALLAVARTRAISPRPTQIARGLDATPETRSVARAFPHKRRTTSTAAASAACGVSCITVFTMATKKVTAGSGDREKCAKETARRSRDDDQSTRRGDPPRGGSLARATSRGPSGSRTRGGRTTKRTAGRGVSAPSGTSPQISRFRSLGARAGLPEITNVVVRRSGMTGASMIPRSPCKSARKTTYPRRHTYRDTNVREATAAILHRGTRCDETRRDARSAPGERKLCNRDYTSRVRSLEPEILLPYDICIDCSFPYVFLLLSTVIIRL